MASTASDHNSYPASASGYDQVDYSLEDPLQCVYCGKLTEEFQCKCPHCHRSLIERVRVAKRATSNLMFAILFLMMLVFLFGTEAVGALVRLALDQPQDPPATLRILTEAQLLDPRTFSTTTVLSNPFVRLLFGNPEDLTIPLANRLSWIAVIRIGATIVLAVLLLMRWTPAYYGGVAILAVSLLWGIVQIASGYTGPLTALGDMTLTLLSLVVLFRSDDNFAVKIDRLQVVPNKLASHGPGNYHWGLRYSREGKHGLATLHFRRAVGAEPLNAAYYKSLGLSYARIGHYQLSLKALAEANRQAPQDSEIPRMQSMVAEMQSKAAAQRK